MLVCFERVQWSACRSGNWQRLGGSDSLSSCSRWLGAVEPEQGHLDCLSVFFSPAADTDGSSQVRVAAFHHGYSTFGSITHYFLATVKNRQKFVRLKRAAKNRSQASKESVIGWKLQLGFPPQRIRFKSDRAHDACQLLVIYAGVAVRA